MVFPIFEEELGFDMQMQIYLRLVDTLTHSLGFAK